MTYRQVERGRQRFDRCRAAGARCIRRLQSAFFPPLEPDELLRNQTALAFAHACDPATGTMLSLIDPLLAGAWAYGAGPADGTMGVGDDIEYGLTLALLEAALPPAQEHEQRAGYLSRQHPSLPAAAVHPLPADPAVQNERLQEQDV